MRLHTFIACALLALPAWAGAQCFTDRTGATLCPPADAQCITNRYGDWTCSPPGGGAAINVNGEPVCGPGACVTDVNATVMCSSQSRGSAELDRYSKAVCTGGCVAATAQQCKALTK